MPNAIVDGFTARLPGELEGAPTPAKDTVWAGPPAPSVKASEAERLPVPMGAKTSVTSQLELAGSVAAQVLPEILKLPAPVPEIAILAILTDEDPVFVKVTVLGPPVFPTGTLGQVMLPGLTPRADTLAQPLSPSELKRRSADAKSGNTKRVRLRALSTLAGNAEAVAPIQPFGRRHRQQRSTLDLPAGCILGSGSGQFILKTH